MEKKMKSRRKLLNLVGGTPDKSGENTNLEYCEGVGRRKTSIARVRIYPKKREKDFLVNDKNFEDYFKTLELRKIGESPFKEIGSNFYTTVKVSGGGIRSQATALKLGISRALVVFNPEFRHRLRAADYLTRDARKRERKKFGLKRARRAPQWRKR
ncbi:MAG: 30S ribosomal protein S9 [bacterium]|nr:30S ribosomal protein S9 [bacterium]